MGKNPQYALSLDLEDSGFDSTVLCEFRARLVAGNAECLLFDKLLGWCRERKMLKARGKQRTDSTHILAAVRGINRLECVIEAMRNALNAIAKESPEWLHQLFQEEWLSRYNPRHQCPDSAFSCWSSRIRRNSRARHSRITGCCLQLVRFAER